VAGMEGRGPVVGAVAGAAVLVAIVLVVLLAGGSSYTVHARFTNASQIVKGNAVKVSGESVGSVGDIRLTDDGQADVTLNIDADGFHPLRRGTRAIVRQTSLSGVANRYVDLQLGGANGAKIPDGGDLPTDSTEAAVDLDQIFNTFDPRARAGTQKTIEFLRDFQAGNEEEANAALQYLNPALSSTSRLFAEVNRNTPDFKRFIVETSKLVTDASANDDVLGELVSNLAATTSALTSHDQALADSIGLLPDVLRKSNTTFVNLRASLEDLTPLVNDAKPIVADKLGPFVNELRNFAVDARPAVRDVSATVRRKGANNDLVELLRKQPALDKIATQTAQRNGKDRPGALPEAIKALEGVTPQLAFLRPYSPDLVGWFDDFSTSGAYDAMGSFSRAALELNGFSLGPLLNLLPVPPELRNALLSAGVKTGRNNRCPGANERGAVYKPSPDFNCDASQVPVGP
jgi:phospholipid/cholesterol/gamma-HCH transport system substrate-binding protein